MSGTDDNATPTDARIGFRDIYRAVGESEGRITLLINERFGALGKDVGDHETRLRIMEQSVAPVLILAEARDRRIEEVATLATGAAQIATTASGDVKAMKDTQRGVLSTLSAGKQLIIVAAAGVGCVSGLIALVHTVVP